MTSDNAEDTGGIRPFLARFFDRVSPLFLLCVAVPTVSALVYFGFIASDVYVSESRYIVRTQGRQAPSGLASLLVGMDSGNLSGNAGSALAEYALSRDAMNALNARKKLVEIYSRPEIDMFSRLSPMDSGTTREDLHRFFTKHVSIEQDSSTSITKLVVRAYRPEDARWVNEQLLQLGENLVNRLNQRSQEDLVRFARREVVEAKEGARLATLTLANYRNQNALIDPEKQAGVSLQMISKLQDEMILTRTQLMQMRVFTPKNPQIPVLQTRIRTLENEIKGELMKVAGNRGSLAAKTAEYTRLALEVEYSEKLLATAMVSLQNADNDARRQQAYVERIVQPNLSDEATEPRRLRSIFSVFVLGLVSWGVLTMLLSAMREHKL